MATACILASATFALGTSTLNVAPDHIEVGIVRPASSTTTTITVTNHGASPVKLLSADVSCKMCTHVVFTPTTVKSGKSASFKVIFSPPESEEGLVRRLVVLHTSDPTQANIKIPLTGYVTRSAAVWPTEISPAAPLPPGSDLSFDLELMNVSQSPLIPLYATGPLDGPQLKVPHTPIPPGARKEIHVHWHLPAKAGTQNGQVILFVDHPQLTKISIPFHAIVQAAPVTQPAKASNAASVLPPSSSKTGEIPVPSKNPGEDPAKGTSESAQTGLEKSPTTQPVRTVNLDLKESIPLKDFVEIVSEQLKLNLIYDDNALNVPVSVRLSGPLPVDALLPLLKTILQAKGLAMVPTDRPEIWRIVTSREAQSLTEPKFASGAKQPTGPGQIVTEFITPKSIDLETAAGLLRSFLTPNAGQLTTVPRINSMIVTDYSSQLARLHRLMDLIDKPQATAKVAIVPIKAAEAAPLADRITKLLGEIDKTEGRSTSDKLVISPSDDGKSLVIVGPEDQIPRVTKLIDQFDTAPTLQRVDYPISDQNRAQSLETIRQVLGKSASEEGRDGMPTIVSGPQSLSVLATEGQHRRIKDLLLGSTANAGTGVVELKAYRIENRDVAEIYATLTRLLGDNRGGGFDLDLEESKATRRSSFTTEGVSRVGSVAGEVPPKTGQTSPSASIVAPPPSLNASNINITIDQGTNTLLIAATEEAHQRIAKLIKQLDQKQAQVLLEVMMVSVTDSDTFNAAVDAAIKGSFGGSTLAIGTNNSGIGTGNFIQTPSVVPGLNGAIFNPASFSVFMSALEKTNKARVLNSPQILALDNKPALLQSTEEQPYTSVNASTTVSTTSFGGFAEAGTTLELTPHIAPGDYLNLEYRLEVSTFSGNSSTAGVPPPKQSNAITSFVSIPDGSTVVLGGLRSSGNSRTVSKVPGLGEIPILGWIGRNQSDTHNNSIFYVFVRPTILRASKFQDLKELTAERRHETNVAGDYPETKLKFIK